MSRLILVRHGKTNWSDEKRLQGSLDIPLNDDGIKEVEEISKELSKINIDAIYTAPESCCMYTANSIAKPHKVKIKTLKELKEFNHGAWQGLLLSDVKKRYKKQYANWKASPMSGKPPKGESAREAYDRATNIMHKLIDKNKGKTVCIVSGDILLSMVKCHIKNIDVDKLWDFVPGKTWWDIIDIK